MNAAIDNTIIRESEWTHKKSTAVASEAVFNYAMNLQCPQSEVSSLPAETGSKERVKLTHALKASAKKKVFSNFHEPQKKHLNTLLKQGDYLKFAE